MTPHRVLRARPGGLAVLLAVLVLALHLAALAWLGQAFQPLATRRLPEPIYTQLLHPTPAPSPAQKPAATPELTRAAVHPDTEQTTPAIPAPPPATPPMPPPVETAAASIPAALISAPQPPASAPAIASEPGNPGNASASSPASPSFNSSAAIHVASAPLPLPPSSAPAATAPAWPPSTKLSYTITGYWRGDLHGSGALVWTVDGNHYEATLSGSALVGFSYRSIGRIDGNWLAPERYTERLFIREKSVRFDRNNNTLHFSANSDVVPMPPHVQDSASLFLQLANRLTRHPEAFHPGATLTFAVARPSGMTDWTFTVVGMQTVMTPMGPLSCWHIVRHATDPNQLSAQIWLSPQMQNLPVQIRLQHAADSYLLFTLDRAEQQAPPQSPASAAR